MALKSHADLLSRNAAAIVADAQVLDAALAQFDRHVFRSGVDTVFHQLLDCCCRAFDNLASGNLADNLL